MIKIDKKPMTEWKAFDFVLYYKSRYEEYYGQAPSLEYIKDCSIMKRVINNFRKLDRPKSLIPSFIDWAFEKYTTNQYYTTPLTIGFLSYWVTDYLQVSPVSDTKKKKKETKPLSDEMKIWLEEQRRTYTL